MSAPFNHLSTQSKSLRIDWFRIIYLAFTAALLSVLILGLFSTLSQAQVGDNLFTQTRREKQKMKDETMLTLDNLRNYHYTRMQFSEFEDEEILRLYMETLDYSRLFFLQSDENDVYLRFRNTLKTGYMRQGNLYPAFEVFRLYRDRVESRMEWIFSRIQLDFDFSTDETYVPDRSELEWPKSIAEADDLWEKRLKYDLLIEVLAGDTLDQAKDKVRRRYERSRKAVRDIDADNVQEYFLNSLTSLYDPHSNFFSTDTLEEFNIQMRNSLVGIGALLRDEDGYCVIQELVSGGPAEMSGRIHPGDKIIEVGQGNGNPVDVVDMKLRDVVKKIRGDKGTVVKLTIIPADASDPSQRKIVPLVRNEVQLTANLAEATVHEVPTDNGESMLIGVIELPSFYGTGGDGEDEPSVTQDVEELIVKLRKHNIAGLVIDMRRNGGGLLSEAIQLTGLFIPRGPVVQVRETTGRVRENWDQNPKVAYDGPLAVLVSRRSASASEIVAGALQNHRRAVIIGDPQTHGKGTVQAVIPLQRGLHRSPLAPEIAMGATKITIQKFYLPNGESTQNEGVHSDIAIPSINEYLPIGESDLPNALVWDTIDPLEWDPEDTFVSNGVQVDENLLASLSEMHQKRMQDEEEFDYMKRSLNWFRERQEREEYSLNLETRKAQREADEALRKQLDDEYDRLSIKNYAMKEVLLDLSMEKEEEHQEKLGNSYLPNGKPKSNTFWQKVFYYQPEENGKITQVFVEEFDWKKISENKDKIVAFFQEKTDKAIDKSKVEELLQHFKNADRGSDFLIETELATRFEGTFTSEEIEVFMPDLMTRLISIDPDVLQERVSLDILMREGLRVVRDWVTIQDKAKKSAALAASQEKRRDNS